MRNLRISFLFIFTFILFALILPNNVMAADANISSSVTTMQTTESATITASVSSSETWLLKMSASGGNLSGTPEDADAAGSEVSKNVITSTFTATEPGTYTIALKGTVAGSDLEVKDISKTVTINVVKPVEPEPEQPTDPEPEEPTTPTVVKSSDAGLKSLTAQTSGSGLSVSQDGTKYSTTVESNISAVTFTVTANSDKASIDSNRSTSGIGFVKNSGSGSQKTYTMSSLREGNNVIKITIEAEDGTQRSYNFVVTRKVAENTGSNADEPTIVTPNIDENPIDNSEPQEDPEDNTTDELGLKTLVITGVELSPTFSPTVYEYTATVEGSDTVEVIAMSSIEDATIEVVGNTNLVIGENLITVLVKKDDEVKTYQIILTKTEGKLTTEVTNNNVVTTSGDSGFSWKYIAIIAAAVIIAIIIIMRLVSMSKKTVDDIYPRPNKKEKKVKKNKKEPSIYDELDKKDSVDLEKSEHKGGKRFK